VKRAFDGQFLWVLARPAEDPAEPGHGGVGEHLQRLSEFVDRWDDVVGHWRHEVERSEGCLALWGAGAKGVTFLNAVDPEGSMVVVDLNPRKWKRYMPGSGHRVDAPASLGEIQVSKVLVTNPAYVDEIGEMLRDLGVRAEVIAV
jgi:hypothetical protein